MSTPKQRTTSQVPFRAPDDVEDVSDEDASESMRPTETFVSNGENWRARVVTRSLGPAADKAVQRGQALISAASHIIHRGGEDELTMQKVAAEAGLSLRVLYQHFASKDDLLVALFEESQAVFVRLMKQYVERYDAPLDRLGAALYFATDPRLHTRQSFNAAMARYNLHLSMVAPAEIGRARRPLFDFMEELIGDVAHAGVGQVSDNRAAAAYVLLGYGAFSAHTYVGNSLGGPLPTGDQFVGFCLGGLGISIDAGWTERFHLTEENAAPFREQAERLAGGARPTS